MKDTLRSGYDRSASGYDAQFLALQRIKYAALLGARGERLSAMLAAGGRVLDLGCGTGLLRAWLDEVSSPTNSEREPEPAVAREPATGFDHLPAPAPAPASEPDPTSDAAARPIVGLDLSSGMLAHAAARGLACVHGDMDHLPFADGAFDLVCAFTVLAIAPGPLDRALTEIARVLRPGATLALSVLSRGAPTDLARSLRAAGLLPGPPIPCGQDLGHIALRATSHGGARPEASRAAPRG